MIVLFLISFLITFGYIAYIKYKFNVSSISESYYEFVSISSKLKYIFLGWTACVTFTLFPIWVENVPEFYEFLTFLSVISLLGVGCAPNYLTTDKITHYVFAGGTALFAILSNISINYGILTAILITLGTITPLILNRRDWLFWAEVLSFLSVFISLGFILFK